MKHHFRFGHYPCRIGRQLPQAILAMGSIMESVETSPPQTGGAARSLGLLAANAA
jgi:hypothetical protein